MMHARLPACTYTVLYTDHPANDVSQCWRPVPGECKSGARCLNQTEITSQRLLDQNHRGPHTWENATYPPTPFWAVCIPYPKGLNPVV